MLLQVALNGNRRPSDHPHLPLTPEQVATDAQRAVAAGAGALHVHVRDALGRESLEPVDVAHTLRALRSACPHIPLGISTGAWIVPDLHQRIALIQGWDELPDFVSVNLHEHGAIEVIHLVLDKRIGVEAGIWYPQAAERLVAGGMGNDCVRILLEVTEQDVAAARANVQAIEAVLDVGGVSCSRLLHGEGIMTWTMIADAVARGYDTRIGLEDTLTLPDGKQATNNAELVRAAMHIITSTAARA